MQHLDVCVKARRECIFCRVIIRGSQRQEWPCQNSFAKNLSPPKKSRRLRSGKRRGAEIRTSRYGFERGRDANVIFLLSIVMTIFTANSHARALWAIFSKLSKNWGSLASNYPIFQTRPSIRERSKISLCTLRILGFAWNKGLGNQFVKFAEHPSNFAARSKVLSTIELWHHSSLMRLSMANITDFFCIRMAFSNIRSPSYTTKFQLITRSISYSHLANRGPGLL